MDVSKIPSSDPDLSVKSVPISTTAKNVTKMFNMLTILKKSPNRTQIVSLSSNKCSNNSKTRLKRVLKKDLKIPKKNLKRAQKNLKRALKNLKNLR